MGSAFQAYAVILLIMLKAGGAWLERRGHSQEFFDSCVITAWGIVNTFTEHQGGPVSAFPTYRLFEVFFFFLLTLWLVALTA